jgi:hypothetical protein
VTDATEEIPTDSADKPRTGTTRWVVPIVALIVGALAGSLVTRAVWPREDTEVELREVEVEVTVPVPVPVPETGFDPGTESSESTSPTAPPGFPREVQLDSIQDERIRNSFRENNPNAQVAIEVVPGVYADRGQGPVQPDPSIYGGVYGACVDVKPFYETYDTFGGSCF